MSIASQFAFKPTAEGIVIPFPSIPGSESGYRRIAGPGPGQGKRVSGYDRWRLGRDLPPSMHDEMLSLSYMAWRMNPLAHRLIEMQVSFVLGSGITLNAETPEMMAFILDWWTNTFTAMEQKTAQRLRDLYIYGELLFRPMYDPINGQSYLGDIQVDQISDVTFDGLSHSEIDTVILREVTRAGSVEKEYPAPVVRRRLVPISRNNVHLTAPDGDVHYFGINRSTDAVRGVGELFPVLDMLDLYDSVMMSRAEKIFNVSKIWWDLTLEDMDAKQIDEYMKKERAMPPEPGTVWAHNQKSALTMVAPDMKADDLAVDTSNFKSFVVSSMGWPGTYFDDPGDAGRAVGAEMAEPAIKNILFLQAEFGKMLRAVINYAAHMAIKNGDLSPDKDYKGRDLFSDARIPRYSLSFSRPSSREFQRTGPALARFGSFISSLQGAELISQNEARAMVAEMVNSQGLTSIQMPIAIPPGLPLESPVTLLRKANEREAKITEKKTDLELQQARLDIEAQKKAAQEMAAFNSQNNAKVVVKSDQPQPEIR